MLAPDPATARTWRPLLVFHMTGDIPVYATSAINDGMTDTRNRDLNGALRRDARNVAAKQRWAARTSQGAGR